MEVVFQAGVSKVLGTRDGLSNSSVSCEYQNPEEAIHYLAFARCAQASQAILSLDTLSIFRN